MFYLFAQYFLIVLAVTTLVAHQRWLKTRKTPAFQIRPGDKITTITGITGTVVSLQGHVVVLMKNDGQFSQVLKLTIIDVQHE